MAQGVTEEMTRSAMRLLQREGVSKQQAREIIALATSIWDELGLGEALDNTANTTERHLLNVAELDLPEREKERLVGVYRGRMLSPDMDTIVPDRLVAEIFSRPYKTVFINVGQIGNNALVVNFMRLGTDRFSILVEGEEDHEVVEVDSKEALLLTIGSYGVSPSSHWVVVKTPPNVVGNREAAEMATYLLEENIKLTKEGHTMIIRGRIPRKSS